MRLRSLLFVPGDSEKKFAKAGASNADVLICDLEDAVAPSQKEAARAGRRVDEPGGGGGPQAVRAGEPARHGHDRR